MMKGKIVRKIFNRKGLVKKTITQLFLLSFILSGFSSINLDYAESYPDPYDDSNNSGYMPVYNQEWKTTMQLFEMQNYSYDSDRDEGNLISVPPSDFTAPDNATDEEGRLIEQLGDDDPEVRQSAIDKFVKIGVPAADTLIKRGLDSNNPNVVEGAIETLTKIGGPIVNDLINVLIAHDNPKKVQGAAIVLGKIGDDRALPYLIKESLINNDQKVLQATVGALEHAEGHGVIGILILIKASLNEDAYIFRKAAETLAKNPFVEALSESLYMDTKEVISILVNWFKTAFAKDKSGFVSKIDSIGIKPIDIGNVKKVIGIWNQQFGSESVLSAFKKNPFEFGATMQIFQSSGYFMDKYGYDGLSDFITKLDEVIPLTEKEIKAVFADMLKSDPKSFGDLIFILTDYNRDDFTSSIKYLSSLLGDEYVKFAFEENPKEFMAAMRMIGWRNLGSTGSFKDTVNLAKNGDNRAIFALLDLVTGNDGPVILISGKSILMDFVAAALGVGHEVDTFSKEISGAFKKLIPQTQMDEKTWQNAAKFALLYAMKVNLLAKEGHYWKIATEDLGTTDVIKAINDGKIERYVFLNEYNVMAIRDSQVNSMSLAHMLAVGFLESTERFHNLEDGIYTARVHELLNAHIGTAFRKAAGGIGAEAARISKDSESEEFIYSLRAIQSYYRKRGDSLDVMARGNAREVFQYWNYAERDTILPKYEEFYYAISKFAKEYPKFSFLSDNIIREPK